MRFKRIAILVFLGAALFTFGYVCGLKSAEYESQRTIRELGFYISDQPPEWNYWDVPAIGGLVTGLACLLAAVWPIRRN
jgi:hypothetical protein